MRGAKVYSENAVISTGTLRRIPTASLANGVYIVKVSNGKETLTSQFAKNK
jgi:hypothetical protein